MLSLRLRKLLAVAAFVALAAALIVVGGCSKKSEAPKSTGSTALAGLDVAQSSLATMAPDARLLLVQTAEAATPTGTPVWAYLFGDPKSGKTFAVYVLNGKSMGAQEYGDAGLSEEEWAKVPETEPWPIDSDEAYAKALDASGATTDPTGWMMGLITYKPAEDTSTVQAYVWNVQFDPGESGATTEPINVDAKTGEAKIAK